MAATALRAAMTNTIARKALATVPMVNARSRLNTSEHCASSHVATKRASTRARISTTPTSISALRHEPDVTGPHIPTKAAALGIAPAVTIASDHFPITFLEERYDQTRAHS